MAKAKKKPLNFKQSFSEAVVAGQRKWGHDRSTTLGASEVFGCLRQMYFRKREPDSADKPEDPTEVSWGHTERGNLIENSFAVPKLQSMFGADRCFYMGEDQKTFVSGLLSATPDGLVVEQERDALSELPDGPQDIGEDSAEIAIEIKSFDPRTDLTTAKARHIGQNIVQMGVLQEKTNYRPKWGIILYINPVDVSDIRPFVIKFDPAVYEKAKERAARVFAEGAKPEDFIAEGKATGDCVYCEFAYRCREAELHAVSSEIVDMEDISENYQLKLKELALKVAHLRALKKNQKKDLSTAEEELKQLLNSLGTKRVGKDGWSVSISSCKGKKKLNTQAMEDAGIDLEEYTEVGQGYLRLNVSVKGVEAGEDD
jgi:hypothetical protein